MELPADIYWYACDAATEEEHIDAIVDALFEAVRKPDVRLWSPFNVPLIKATFRKRLEQAAQGALRPPGELKPLGDGRPALYEIRWSNIAVRERPAEDPVHREIEVRLIHGEPDTLGVCIYGLHVHEKWLGGSETEKKAAQDEEIDIARARYLDLEARAWPITRRE